MIWEYNTHDWMLENHSKAHIHFIAGQYSCTHTIPFHTDNTTIYGFINGRFLVLSDLYKLVQELGDCRRGQ